MLDLSYTHITRLPSHLIVGLAINLAHTSIYEVPDDLLTGYGVRSDHKLQMEYDHRLMNGCYEPGKYLYLHQRLVPVKRKEKYQGYEYYVGKIPDRNVLFDGTYYCLCQNLQEGILELKFEHAQENGRDQYKNLSLDEELPAEELIIMYKVITMAGVHEAEAFIAELGNQKSSFTLREAMELVKGKHGSNVFKEYFSQVS